MPLSGVYNLCICSQLVSLKQSTDKISLECILLYILKFIASWGIILVVNNVKEIYSFYASPRPGALIQLVQGNIEGFILIFPLQSHFLLCSRNNYYKAVIKPLIKNKHTKLCIW